MNKPRKPTSWEPAWDHKTQKWFYQDRSNGVSSWERPAGITFDLPKEPPKVEGEKPDKPAEPCPSGWEAAWEPTSKKWYYFNRETEERKWTFKPKSTAAGAPAAGAKASSPGLAASMPAAGALSSQPGGMRAAPASLPAGREGRNPGGGAREEYQGGRGGGRARQTGEWDAEEFLRRLKEARSTGDIRQVKRVLVDVSESNYQLRDRWRPIPRTTMLTHAELMRRTPTGGSVAPEITFGAWTTADALKHFAKQRGREVCALNFANGASVGGGYKNGAIAQEEDLCRRCPTLYTSLNNGKRDGFYPFGPSTCFDPDRPEKYCNILWTPDVVLARGHEDAGYALWSTEEQVQFALITAAAPNVKGREVYDLNLMYNTVKSIFTAPPLMNNRINTLVLGAWGCGVFGCDPRDICELFIKAINQDKLAHIYQEIHFAIPSFSESDTNGKIFLDILRKNRIDVKEI